MSDNASVKKKSQQAILNYISVNFQKMDVNNQNKKSSAETASSAHRTPKEQRPKNTACSTSSARGINGGPQTRKISVSTNSALKAGNVTNPSLNPKLPVPTLQQLVQIVHRRQAMSQPLPQTPKLPVLQQTAQKRGTTKAEHLPV